MKAHVKRLPKYIYVCPLCREQIAHRSNVPPHSRLHRAASHCETTGKNAVPVRYVRAPTQKRPKVKR